MVEASASEASAIRLHPSSPAMWPVDCWGRDPSGQGDLEPEGRVPAASSHPAAPGSGGGGGGGPIAAQPAQAEGVYLDIS